MTATPPRADLRTLAAEAIRQLRGPHGPLEDGSFWTKMGSDDELADAVLAAVLPEHRRMVLAEAADLAESMVKTWPGMGDQAKAGNEHLRQAARRIRRLAAAAPETTLSATVPAEPAPAVPEDTPGGFHEPDEPTDRIAAAFDAGAHGRTAPPRGQTRRLDVAAGRQPWSGMLCGAEHRGMLCDRQQGHQGDHVDIYGPLPGHTWTDTDAAVDALPDAPLGSPSTGTPAPKATAKDTDPTEGWEPTFFERRASRDPSIDHSSHSMQWVGRCPECPSDTAPEGADERNGHG